MLRVLRWSRRTRSRSSIRATALPIADDETPSCRPATVKLRASAARTKAFSDPRLSIRGPSIADNRVRYVWSYGPLFKLRHRLSLAHVNAFVFLGSAPASSIARHALSVRDFAGTWRSPLTIAGPAPSNEKRTIMTMSLETAEESKLRNVR